MNTDKITEKKAEKAQALDYRCECGGLMAKIIPAGIEIKCRRCKRIHCIPFENVQCDGGLTSSRIHELTSSSKNRNGCHD